MSTDTGTLRSGRLGRWFSGPRRAIIVSSIGTSLEWYDYFLYGTAAVLVFGRLFFPDSDPATRLLLSLATFGVGFASRPVGAVLFGHFGDRLGRRDVLAATFLVMGTSTFLIGLLPGYASIGVVAPVLLVLLRVVQGLSLGGQWGGAVLMAMEHGTRERRGVTSSWVQVGVPVGNILSTGLLALAAVLLPNEAFLEWGWRIPFLLSGGLALMGLWIRRGLTESPEFEAMGRPSRSPLLEVLRTHPRALGSAFLARIGSDVVFYVFTFYLLTYLDSQFDMDRSVGLTVVVIASAVQLPLLVFYGRLSDRWGRRRVYAFGAIGSGVWVFAFFPLLDTGVFWIITAAVVGGIVFEAAMYGPQAAFIAELFAPRVRYSGTGLGYQVAGVPSGALAPIVAVMLYQWSGSAQAVAWYVVASVLVTLVGLALSPGPWRGPSQAPAQAPAPVPLARDAP
ncbi:MFS transporter [Nocardiopsis aegyptia]|uniref:MFS transporter n=1 Tax=Nocardiopsis aegyptia TaxID=220378 RepID=UPI00366A95C1